MWIITIVFGDCLDGRGRAINMFGAMNDATVLKFINHEELAVYVIEDNFPSWGHWHLVIKLERA